MKLSFHGATRQVTGSCFLLETHDADGNTLRLLFDCGMFQGERMCGSKNLEDFGFDPSTVDHVFITHAHADHTARLPKLVKEGFSGTITFTHPTLALTKIILKDAFNIMTENSKRCGDPVLYQEEDLLGVWELSRGVNYHESVHVAPGVEVMFHDAGHILGSSYISVDTEGKRLVFSGDLGNDHVPILPETEPISHADYVICEATYGNRFHEPMEERRTKLKEAIKHVCDTKSVLMIPAFSIERTQELLYEINNMIHEFHTDVPIYLDSPMAIRATETYRHYKGYLKFDKDIMREPDKDFFSFPNLKETLSSQESMVINEVSGAKIIIAGSGMMSGGRIMHHLIRYLPHPENLLLIIGYQAYGTLGRQIFDGAKKVQIFGKDISVKARVQAIGGFSAHADQKKLTQWLKPAEGPVPKKIFLVHGDSDVKDEFAEHLKKELKTEVVIPEFRQEFEL